MATTVKRVKVVIKGDNSDIKKKSKEASTTAERLGKSFQKAGKRIAKAFGVVAVAGIVLGTKAVIEYEKELINVSTLFDTAVTNVEGMSDAILRMAGPLGSAKELTQGLYQAISAGQKPAEALLFIEKTAQFSKAALTDMGAAVDVVTTVMNAFQLEAGKTERVTNVLFETVRQGKITGQELASSLGTAIPPAAALGIEFEQVAASMAVLTKFGIDANTASTSLGATFNAIIQPTEDAKNSMQELGVEFSRAGVEKAGGFQKFLEKIKDSIGDNDEALAKYFPNVRALRAAFTLTGKGAAEFESVLDKVRNATDTVSTAFAKQSKTMSEAFKGVGNQIEAAFIKKMLPALKDFAGWIIDNRDGITDFFKGIFDWSAAIVGTAADLANAFIFVGKSIAGLLGFFSPVTNAAILLTAAMIAATSSTVALSATIAILNKTIKGGSLIVIAALAALLVSLNKIYGEIGETQKKLAESEKTQESINRKSVERFREMRNAVNLTGRELQFLREQFKNVENPTKRMRLQMEAIRDGKFQGNIRDLTKEYAKWKEGTREVVNEQERLGAEAEALKKKLEDQQKAVEALNKKTSDYLDSLGVLSKSGIRNAKDQIEFLTETYRKNESRIVGVSGAVTAFKDELGPLIKGLEAAGVAIPKDQMKAFSDIMEKEVIISVLNGEEAVNAYADAELEAVDAGVMENIVLSDMHKKLPPVIKDFNEAAEEARRIKERQDDLNKAMKDAPGFIMGVADSLQTMGIVSEDVGNLIGNMGAGFGNVKGAIDKFKSKAGGISGLMGKISGGFAIATTAVEIFSGILGALAGKSGQLEAAERSMRGISGGTKDWAMEVENLALQMKEAGKKNTAFATLIPQIAADVGITNDNFDVFIGKTRNVISLWHQGAASTTETQKLFGAAFQTMADAADELGISGNSAMRGLVQLTDEWGVEVKEVSDFIAKNTTVAVDGWRKVMANFTGASIPELEEMIRLQDTIASIPEEIASELEGATEAIIGLSNANKAAVPSMEAIGKVAEDVRIKLEKEGITGSDAFKAMEDLLQELAFRQAEFGFQVDAGTQAMIDQGIANGDLATDSRSNSEIMNDGIAMINENLQEMIRFFKGELPGAVEAAAEGFSRGMGSMNEDALALQDGLNGVATTITGEVTGAIGAMGDKWDDVTAGNSIFPDMDFWIKKNKEVGGSIKSDVIVPIDDMGKSFNDANDMQIDVLDGFAVMANQGSQALRTIHDDAADVVGQLDNLSRTMKVSVGDAIGDMGDAWDDELRGNSILPDIDEWKKKLSEVGDSMSVDLVSDIRGMGDAFDQANERQFDMAEAFTLIQKNGEGAISAIENGWLSTAAFILQSTENAKKAIESEFDSLVDAGQAGTKAFIEMIEMNDQLATGFEKIDDFVRNTLQKGFEGFQKLAGLTDAGDLEKQMTGLEKELGPEVELKSGSAKDKKAFDIEQARRDEIRLKMREVQAQIDQTNILMGLFGDTTIDVFEKMEAFQERVASSQILVDGIKAWGDQFVALSETQRLNQDQFDGFAAAASNSFDALIAQGFSSDEALGILQPQLEKLKLLVDDFGLSTEGPQQGFLDMVDGSDILKDAVTDDVDIMKTGYQALIDELKAVADSLETTIPDAATAMVSQTSDGLDNIRKTLKGDIPNAVEAMESSFNTGANGINGNIQSIISRLSGLAGRINNMPSLSVGAGGGIPGSANGGSFIVPPSGGTPPAGVRTGEEVNIGQSNSTTNFNLTTHMSSTGQGSLTGLANQFNNMIRHDVGGSRTLLEDTAKQVTRRR